MRQKIGSTSRPDKLVAVDDLPKTRSGKIMRRILRNIAEGEEELGDAYEARRPERRRHDPEASFGTDVEA